MSKRESPPFQRGETYFGIGGTPDATSGFQHEGQEFDWEDVDLNSTDVGVKPHRSELPVTTRIVRNVSGFAVLPKRCVNYKSTDHGQIDGYCDVTAEGPLVVVDEYLPSAGCANNDLCHVVVEGPALVSTSLAGTAVNVINAGDRVVGATAATSGATTAGRVEVQNKTITAGSAASDLGNQIQNAVGVALSAKTTANTAADLLISVRRF